MAGQIAKTLWRTVLPLVLGGAVAAWLAHKYIDAGTLESISFDTHTIVGLCMAAVFVLGRDFGLAWRFHTIAAGDLTWARAWRTDLMCAFTSAITPSVVGGSALAVFYLNREGIDTGRATSLTLTTLFLDELFFVVFCPVIAALVPLDSLFAIDAADTGGAAVFFGGVRIVFWLVYAGIVVWTFVLYMAILGRPDTMKRILHRISQWRMLRRWSKGLAKTADNMEASSHWVKGRPFKWWASVLGATVLSWFSRYFVVNALFWAFVPAASGLLVFGRQFVVWVVLMVSPTPGGSGISEWLFTTYYGDIIGNAGIAAVIALIWRLFSYYIYLIAGAALLPGYFNRKSADNS